MRRMLIATAALVIAAAPAAARTDAQLTRARDNSAAEQPQGGSAESGASERRICVTERISGSRMPRRVCRTAREWKAQEDGSDAR